MYYYLVNNFTGHTKCSPKQYIGHSYTYYTNAHSSYTKVYKVSKFVPGSEKMGGEHILKRRTEDIQRLPGAYYWGFYLSSACRLAICCIAVVLAFERKSPHG